MKKIGNVSKKIIDALKLSIKPGAPIYIGDSNIAHMKKKHSADFDKYFENIEEIISKPDYVAVNNKDNSLEYVKEFLVDNNYVKVAVRASNGDKLYARSIYTLNNNRVRNYIEKGRLIPIDK